MARTKKSASDSEIMKRWRDLGFTKDIKNIQRERKCAKSMEALAEYLVNNQEDNNDFNIIGFAMIRKICLDIKKTAKVNDIVKMVVDKYPEYDAIMKQMDISEGTDLMAVQAEVCNNLASQIIYAIDNKKVDN